MLTKILGMGIYLPKNIYSSEDVEKMANYDKYGISSGIVKMVTGVETRHYSDKNELSSDLATAAVKNALKDANLTANDIDALIFCSVTQDFAEPATANVIAANLNLNNSFVFDVKNGCNAFLSGLDIADSLIKTGKANNVVICSGEAISKWVKFNYKSKKEIEEGSPVTLSLGDGAGAFILGKSNDSSGILHSYFKSYPKLWNNNVMWGGGVAFPRDPEKMYIPGTTKPLINKQIEVTKELINKVLRDVNWNLDEVDCIVPSQVANWIVRSVQKELNISDDKFINVLTKWGNVASSNIPLAVYEGRRINKIKKNSKVIFIGGAVGFSSCVFAVQF